MNDELRIRLTCVMLGWLSAALLTRYVLQRAVRNAYQTGLRNGHARAAMGLDYEGVERVDKAMATVAEGIRTGAIRRMTPEEIRDRPARRRAE